MVSIRSGDSCELSGASETIEIDENGARIDNVVRLVGNSPRFPDHQLQIGGFVLTSVGRLAYIRWVPAKQPKLQNSWDALSQSLSFQVPERSRLFLQGAIETAVREQETINVLLLVGNYRYDIGSFVVTAYDPPMLVLVRHPTTTNVSTCKMVPVTEADSHLETQYRRLLREWGVDASYLRTMYQLQTADHVTVWYTPDATLYDVLAPPLLDWCGPENRHHGNCLLEIKPVYPAQDVFVKLRTLARDHRISVLLLYGRPDLPGTDERMKYDNLQYSQGLMAILFRPGDGTSCRVHFNRHHDRVCVVPGEVGEHGPLHAAVLAGHNALRGG